MTLHVDLIENDWSERVQRRVARLYVNGAGIDVDGPHADEWKAKLVHRMPQPQTGEELDPQTAPKDFLEALATALRGGSYMFALGPHQDESCPVPENGVLAMEAVEVRPQPF